MFNLHQFKFVAICLFVLVMVLPIGATVSTTRPAFAGGSSGPWSLTGSLNTPRLNHTATLLPNGRVLVVGGQGNTGVLASAELFSKNSWHMTGSMGTAHASHTATLLNNGLVLVAGGITTVPGPTVQATAAAELYNPATGAVDSHRQHEHRAHGPYGHTALERPGAGRGWGRY